MCTRRAVSWVPVARPVTARSTFSVVSERSTATSTWSIGRSYARRRAADPLGAAADTLRAAAMSTETMSLFFALLSLLCWVAVVGVVVLVLLRRSRPDSGAAVLVDDIGRMALWLAWLVASVSTLGSLYYSEIA